MADVKGLILAVDVGERRKTIVTRVLPFNQNFDRLHEDWRSQTVKARIKGNVTAAWKHFPAHHSLRLLIHVHYENFVPFHEENVPTNNCSLFWTPEKLEICSDKFHSSSDQTSSRCPHPEDFGKLPLSTIVHPWTLSSSQWEASAKWQARTCH